jgi:hypothetical protein
MGYDDESAINDEEYEQPEVDIEDDDDIGEWADPKPEPVQPGIPVEQPVAQPVTETEVPARSQVVRPKRKAAKKGGVGVKQSKSKGKQKSKQSAQSAKKK